MKLAQLLGAGKSFFGGQGPLSYRENKHVYVPKFSAAKNPFTPKPKEADEAGGPKPETATVSVPAVVPAAKVRGQAKELATPSTARLKRSAGWADKLNPFRAPQPTAPVLTAVQPEFSLDAVKVLHNDLSDAEVEVVPVKSRTADPAAAPASGPMEYLGQPVLRTT